MSKSYPRSALIGNPSDGYNGKTIAFTFTNFAAEITLYETPDIEILPNTRDHSRFHNIDQLVSDVERFGYYGGIRLLKASVKKFSDYCRNAGIRLSSENFTIRYSSDIPHGLGLAGSSAIITACIRALMTFFAVDISKPILANLVLSVETDELGITAGLQDRVAQVYQGIVYMDFSKEIMAKQGYGHYVYVDGKHLPNLYIGYKTELAEGSEKVHDRYLSKYKQKDEVFYHAVKRWIELSDLVKQAIADAAHDTIGKLLNENFDLRNRVLTVSPGNLELVEAARSTGASAKFTGSGGAVVGTYADDGMFAELEKKLGALGATVIEPTISDRTL